MAAKKTKKATKKAATTARKSREIRITEAEPEVTGEASASRTARGELQKLSTPDLRALYQEVVGRETNSENRQYLAWKIREARKGRIRVGPPRTRVIKGPQQILSVRVDEDAVPLLDAAWRKHGLRSRHDLILKALGRELEALGEPDAAARFADEAEA